MDESSLPAPAVPLSISVAEQETRNEIALITLQPSTSTSVGVVRWHDSHDGAAAQIIAESPTTPTLDRPLLSLFPSHTSHESHESLEATPSSSPVKPDRPLLFPSSSASAEKTTTTTTTTTTT